MKTLRISLILFITLIATPHVFAQFGEPEVDKSVNPRSLFEEGYSAGFGFNFVLNDFGFGAGGQFRMVLSNYTEALFTLKVTGLKDPTEQTFISYFGGRTIAEKYKRVLAVPFYVGLKKRLFAKEISDNFRLFSSMSAGPVFAWSYAYFRDVNENGFRENDSRIYGFEEPVYDIFKGWDQSETHWGVGGEFLLGIDFGENFANLSSVQFGYTMNYFHEGIQIMQPNEADLSTLQFNEGQLTQYSLVHANDKRKYFGSAQISFVFGWMW